MTLLCFVVVSIAYAVMMEFQKTSVSSTSVATSDDVKSVVLLNHRIIAYYFHGNSRCTSCLKIENYSTETIKTNFPDQIKKGQLAWQVLNVEQPENNHFIQDYKLYTKSLVLVEIKNDKQIRWKNLDKVWNYLGDPNQFSAYVSAEIKNYLSGL